MSRKLILRLGIIVTLIIATFSYHQNVFASDIHIGIQAGHWKANIHTGGTSYCDGTREYDLTKAIADRVVAILISRGYSQSVVLSAEGDIYNWTRDGYARDYFDYFVSLHFDNVANCTTNAKGYKVATHDDVSISGPSKQLVDALWSEYHTLVGLPTDYGHITLDMTDYYAFNDLSSDTTEAIIEMGWLSNGDELKMFESSDGQTKMATAIANAIEKVVNSTDSTSVSEIPSPDDYICSRPGFVDFESFADGTDLTTGTIAGLRFINTGGLPWIVGDFGTSNYNGKFPTGAYTSAGTHWAWLGITQGQGRIDFPAGHAAYFSLLTSNSTPVSVDAYNGNNELLTTAGPAASNLSTGRMAELKITRANADMAYVVIHDTANYFVVDDLCTDAPGTPNTIKQLIAQTYPMQTGETVNGNFLVEFIHDALQLIHIIIGPFDSDVDLILTRPDGSIVNPTDPGISYNKTSTQVEVTIDDAQPGQWDFKIIANQLNPGGENINLNVNAQTIPILKQPLMVTIPAEQETQYSDALNLNIGTINAAGNVAFLAEGLPTGLSFVDNGDGTGTLNGLIKDAPGTYIALINATDDEGDSDIRSLPITITPEDARLTYSGPHNVHTGCTTCPVATVYLQAIVQDISAVNPSDDPYPGDITQATVTFVDRDQPDSTICTATPILINLNDPKTAIAACKWQVNLGTNHEQNFILGMVVGGNYTRDSSIDNTIVTVVQSPLNVYLPFVNSK